MISLSSLRRFLIWLALLLPATLVQGAEDAVLVVFGDSLSSGYGIDQRQSWPALLENKIRESGRSVRVVNASRKGETSVGGKRRLQEVLSRNQPKWVILELGANDGLRRWPLDRLGRNLEDMLAMVRQSGATPILVGMQLPPNYDPRYAADFAAVYAGLARQSGCAYVPFLLQKLIGQPELFQADRLHPTAEAQPRLLDTVWPMVDAVLPPSVQGRELVADYP